MKYSKDGKSAYQILSEFPECPYNPLPTAKSMTSARIDYERIQDGVIQWYEELFHATTAYQAGVLRVACREFLQACKAELERLISWIKGGAHD